MQYVNKAVSSLFTCLKAQIIHSPETWDSALDFSSFGAIKILDRVANDSKLKFDGTAVLYVKYVVDTNESQTLPLFHIISFQMVEALPKEAQEDTTPEVGSELSHFSRSSGRNTGNSLVF